MPKGRRVPNLIGQTIDGGRLAVTQLLGAGSNGVVFLAEDTASPSTHTYFYAVKVIAKARFGTRRFENQREEIQNHIAVSDLPGVVTLHRVVEDYRFYYMVMDYHPGGDLFHFLSRGGVARGDNAHIKRLMVQMIETLQDVHRKGVFHRDIKPENILISSDGTRVFLSDFGLSTTQTISTTFGCGSRYYMSPECLGTLGVDAAYSTRANDVWALGIILTAMTTGHNPWNQALDVDECYRAYKQDPMFLRNSLPISDEAHDILGRIFSPSHERVALDFLRAYVLGATKFYDLTKPTPPRCLFFRKRRQQRHAPSPTPPHSYLGLPNDTFPRADPTNECAASASDADSHGPRTPDRSDQLLGLPSLPQLPDYAGGSPSDMLVAAENGQAGPPFRGFFKRMVGKLHI